MSNVPRAFVYCKASFALHAKALLSTARRLCLQNFVLHVKRNVSHSFAYKKQSFLYAKRSFARHLFGQKLCFCGVLRTQGAHSPSGLQATLCMQKRSYA
jgi:hypothetical protein